MVVDFISQFLKDAEASGSRRRLRSIIPVSARECIVDGWKCIDFSSNNYLALADHPKLKEEAVRWTKLYGAGSRASRLVTGTFAPYLELENKIAAWKGSEAALILGSGFLANTGVIPALADRTSAIFADKLNHASLNAGAQLSGAGFKRYRHLDYKHLGDFIDNDTSPRRIIISDTVFSMDGDAADVKQLESIAVEHDALLYLDDAHATGIFGDKGEGLACRAGGAFIAMGTFSKALGSYGAYIACSEEMKEYLVNKCSTFIFSTALPPAAYGAIDAAVDLVQSREYCGIRRELLQKSANLAKEIRRLGFETGATSTPIIPVIVVDSEKALRISRNLLEKGILAVAIRPPTVPKGTARLRLSVNAAHTEDDISMLLQELSANR
ncbi:MAG: 8-amino-7-oxononanoate synthase [Lentisphaerae bacterium GWF2_50_93]|nr:MAG: 8-amino-7-oxononanoate synthase [Lentisphaerae bacterium GWF2_50_93]